MTQQEVKEDCRTGQTATWDYIELGRGLRRMLSTQRHQRHALLSRVVSARCIELRIHRNGICIGICICVENDGGIKTEDWQLLILICCWRSSYVSSQASLRETCTRYRFWILASQWLRIIRAEGLSPLTDQAISTAALLAAWCLAWAGQVSSLKRRSHMRNDGTMPDDFSDFCICILYSVFCISVDCDL